MESRIGLSRTYALHRFGWWSDQQPKNLDIPKQVFYPDTDVLRDKFKGKYMALLEEYHRTQKLIFSGSCSHLRNSYTWKEFKNHLYGMDWCPFIKETFNGFGNAIEYLGRYTHKIAISDSRILSVTESETTFLARGKNPETNQSGRSREESRVYPSFFDACTPLWISENPLLWFSEQPNENKKSKIDFQTPGLSEIQTSLYRSVYCRTTESRMEL